MARELKAFSLRGEVVLFDPDMQIPNCVHMFLWNTEEREVDCYLSTFITSTLESEPNDSSQLQAYLSTYLAWKDKYLADWLATKRPYYASRAKEAADEEAKKIEREKNLETLRTASSLAGQELAERHMDLVIKSGKPYRGLSRPTGGWRRRVTHCYTCHAHLDNSSDVECVSCGWILCHCGACGCGYLGY